MNSLLIARAASCAHVSTALRLPLQRRGYADAVTDKIKLTLALPHQVSCSELRHQPIANRANAAATSPC